MKTASRHVGMVPVNGTVTSTKYSPVPEDVLRLSGSFLRFSRSAGIFAVVVGVVVLIGWVLGIRVVKSLLPGLVTMKANTAACFIMAGTSLLLYHRASSKRLAQLLAGGVLAFSVMTLAQYVLHIDLGLDQLLFTDRSSPETSHPGRMSPIAAWSFALTAVALGLMHFDARHLQRASQAVSVVVIATSFVSLLGYLYGVTGLYHIATFTSIAAHTPVTFVVLAAGVLFARCEVGLAAVMVSPHAGGVLARRLLVLTMFVPSIIGWVHIHGERAGFYETSFGLAWFTVANISVFVVVVALYAAWLNRVDESNQYARTALSLAEKKYRSIFENAIMGMFQSTPEGRFITVNSALASMLGYDSPAELVAALTDIGRQLYVDPQRRADFKRLMEEHGSVTGFECAEYRRDRRQIWVSWNARAVRDECGSVVYYEGIVENITERKQAEDRLRQVVAGAHCLLWHADIEDCGEEYCRWQSRLLSPEAAQSFFPLEVPPGDSYLHTWMRSRFPEDLVAEVADTDAKVRAGESYVKQFRCRDREGSICWFQEDVHVKGVAPGRWVAIGVCTNITQRKEADAELKAAEQSSRSIVETAFHAFIAINADGRITEWNARAEDTFGWQRDEALGRTLTETIIPPQHREQHNAGLKQYLSTGKGPVLNRIIEITALHRDGREFPVELAIWPVHTVSGVVFNAFLRDITERKASEAALLEQTNEIRRLNSELEQRVAERTTELQAAKTVAEEDRALIRAIAEAQDRFIIAESASSIFNRLLQKILDLSGSEYGFIDELFLTEDSQQCLTVRPITDISWSDETRKMNDQFLAGDLNFTNLKSLFGEVITTGAPVIANDAPHDPRRCGVPPGHRPLSAFLGLPLYCNQEFVGVMGLANRPAGYNEQVIAYLAPMVAATANLIVAWRTDQRRQQTEADLERRTSELESANRELEAFAYSVSHDLRAPLRAVDGYSRMIQEDFGDRLGDEGLRQLNVVRAETQRMGQLIDDLLAFSRLGRAQMQLVELDMAGLALSVFDELQRRTDTNHVEFRLPELPRARGDHSMIRQVFVNLLDNALKFTRQIEQPMIEVGMEKANGSRAYYVRDNGAGFDMRYLGKLFGVFQRLHTQEEFEGTGVGLALVQRIIQRHGGDVWAEGRVGKGATFYFTLGIPRQQHDKE